MKITFELNDEITVTNTTVKITASLRGTILGQDRPKLEARALEAAKRLFPDARWAFSNFNFSSDGLTFSVTATTRVDASENDRLDERVKAASTEDMKIQIQNIDPSIPDFEIRKSESDLRLRMISLAKEEATKLGGKVSKTKFHAYNMAGMSNAKSATYARGFALEAAGAPGDGIPTLGHSEKISLTASISVEVK